MIKLSYLAFIAIFLINFPACSPSESSGDRSPRTNVSPRALMGENQRTTR